MMKKTILSLITTIGLLPVFVEANTAPEVVIQSATMRPGTTLMDVVFRVNDPDDATVKTRALAFKDGVRSFANVIKPVTFVEGTSAKLGDAIPTNVNHTLTWNVAADWNIDLGQVKFEVLAMDGRGLLPFEWITIPAAGSQPALTVSKNSPTDAQVLNALFWLYASETSNFTLSGGNLVGPIGSDFYGISLASGSSVRPVAKPFLFSTMGLGMDDGILSTAARVSFDVPNDWHATTLGHSGTSVVGWGYNHTGQSIPPSNLTGIVAVAAGPSFSLGLKNDGTVTSWGDVTNPAANPPSNLLGVTAIATDGQYGLAIKADGSVVGWGIGPFYQPISVPGSFTNVVALSAGPAHALALKRDGTVVGLMTDYWNEDRPEIPPGNLTDVIAIAAGGRHSLALKADGTVVGWGNNDYGAAMPPAGLKGVVAIAAGWDNSLALKSDGTVVGWGWNWSGSTSSGSGQPQPSGDWLGQSTPPTGLNNVVAIAAGNGCFAVKRDGTVVQWGMYNAGNYTLPVGLKGVFSVDAGPNHVLVIRFKENGLGQ
jgi:hypothetical protein